MEKERLEGSTREERLLYNIRKVIEIVASSDCPKSKSSIKNVEDSFTLFSRELLKMIIYVYMYNSINAIKKVQNIRIFLLTIS